MTALGVATTPVGVDEHGAVVSELDGIDTPAVLLTPAHHFPHGVPLHPSRRTALMNWADRTGSYVLDDDYGGEFRRAGRCAGRL
jgi:GntR family transcriptional regulator/MocR family aminotransferase